MRVSPIQMQAPEYFKQYFVKLHIVVKADL
jgi:hypothetical protein